MCPFRGARANLKQHCGIGPPARPSEPWLRHGWGLCARSGTDVSDEERRCYSQNRPGYVCEGLSGGGGGIEPKLHGNPSLFLLLTQVSVAPGRAGVQRTIHVLRPGPGTGPVHNHRGLKGGHGSYPVVLATGTASKCVLGPAGLRVVWPWRAQLRGSPRPRNCGVVTGPPFPHGKMCFVFPSLPTTRQGVAQRNTAATRRHADAKWSAKRGPHYTPTPCGPRRAATTRCKRAVLPLDSV